MIICEVLDISPYELLLGAESKNKKDHREMDRTKFNSLVEGK